MADLVKKLRMQPGQRVLLINAPVGYRESLGELPPGMKFVEGAAAQDVDFVHLFAKNRVDLDTFVPVALAAIKFDGVLWLSYPKRSSKMPTDLSRDRGWELLTQAGLRPVAQISIDAVWSALRFRPFSQVGK